MKLVASQMEPRKKAEINWQTKKSLLVKVATKIQSKTGLLLAGQVKINFLMPLLQIVQTVNLTKARLIK